MSKKKDNSKLITISTITFLIIVFIVGFWYGLSSVLAMEGAYPPVVNAESLSALPETNDAFLGYLNKVVDKSVKEKPAIVNEDSFSIDKKTIVTDGDDAFKNTLYYLYDGSSRDSFDKYLEKKYGEKKVDFSGDSSEMFVLPTIEAKDIVDFACGPLYYVCKECFKTQDVYTDKCQSCEKTDCIEKTYGSYIYYQCLSCGAVRLDPADNCELCGGVQPYAERYLDEYEFTVEIDTKNEEIINKLFGKRSNEDILQLIGDELNDVLSFNSLETKYNKAYIIFKVNRLTDEIVYLEYRKEIDVSADADFTGKFESIGNKKVSFVIVEKNFYKFTWPSLKLNSHEKVVEPKGNDNLLATLVCDDATKYTVTWTSSDENLLKIDDEGYYVAGAKEGTAVVTASFEFNGKTYSDECTVYVRHPVESSKMSKSKIKLNVGETYALEVTVSPKKATVKTVKWYTDNADIADIDENGVVTAKSAGVVTVYSLTDDGYFRSSCEVTVK